MKDGQYLEETSQVSNARRIDSPSECASQREMPVGIEMPSIPLNKADQALFEVENPRPSRRMTTE